MAKRNEATAAGSVRVAVRAGSTQVVAGPSYEIRTEDGRAWGEHGDEVFSSHFDYFPQVETALGATVTYHRGLRREEATRLVVRVEAAGSIDLAYWTTRDPWAAYGDEWQREQDDRRAGEP